MPAIRQPSGQRRKRPAKLHADKAYDIPRCRRFLHRRHIKVRIARKGIESRERLGRHRGVIERTLAWLHRYRRLTIRYERRAELHHAFLTLGCALLLQPSSPSRRVMKGTLIGPSATGGSRHRIGALILPLDAVEGEPIGNAHLFPAFQLYAVDRPKTARLLGANELITRLSPIERGDFRFWLIQMLSKNAGQEELPVR